MDETFDTAPTRASAAALKSDDRSISSPEFARFADQPLTIADDFPSITPIGQVELDAIERYMGEILDEVLGHSAAVSGGPSRTPTEG
jgi:hypothetical protein